MKSTNLKRKGIQLNLDKYFLVSRTFQRRIQKPVQYPDKAFCKNSQRLFTVNYFG